MGTSSLELRWLFDEEPRPDGAHQIVDTDGMTVCFMAVKSDDNETLEIAKHIIDLHNAALDKENV